ncbi:hypothetical protein PMIT1342_01161 [Prochlorococcus marinus str. MIT 1342]|uniref:Uncharacterized protein n=1 Tax=Prochlorococcus marinus (strain MIT 9303) TaxID=59922 RepID=A2C778_PROM3|nr:MULTISPECIES: hypothetical protein [Prochlorococcus]KZR62810.1 hypothetical protein PMIT1312_02280 [Prochlorococcus marinus str. MIT 1312]KZR80710.1 hypothetical protein PMIT1327_01154 [Prochlorococcus marinus str. MIT 1327]ABM77338.1 Conserved hypothetical protein [Prochlorococcus marinus str. MIT 9303]KZR63485.1 hypothetical protein PMIT1303_01855 [Prochlorococcus sp. MIT 1303]KZR75012.1 hypothetical protein PMIT1320_01642 [Prochlorococcus marinus str. MIT 1320]
MFRDLLLALPVEQDILIQIVLAFIGLFVWLWAVGRGGSWAFGAFVVALWFLTAIGLISWNFSE